jgi:hypothetical protein
MSLSAIDLNTLDDLYDFVESTIPRTGLILTHDATYCPWARSVAAAVPEVHWVYPTRALGDKVIEHLCNFAHCPRLEKGFILLEMGRVIRAIDVDAINGSAQPHTLAGAVRSTFEAKRQARTEAPRSHAHMECEDPYVTLGASSSDSDEEIKQKYKRAVMEYHPDRVAHLGRELRDLAAKKTTAINAAYAAIRKSRAVSRD